LLKKILLFVGTMTAVAVGAVGFAAFESHVINVIAHVEKATYVRPDQLDFGITLPQQKYDAACVEADYVAPPQSQETSDQPCMSIHLSDSFLDAGQTQFIDVTYAVYCEDKPCDEFNGVYDANITPFIVLSDSDPSDANDSVLIPRAGTTDNPADTTPDDSGCGEIAWGSSAGTGGGSAYLWAIGELNKATGDLYDLWDMSFYAPICSNNYNEFTDPVDPELIPVPLVISSDYCDSSQGPNSYEEVDLASNVKFQILDFSVPTG
jgi:hypothetical protein